MQHLVWAWQEGRILHRLILIVTAIALGLCLVAALTTRWSTAISDLLVAFLGNTVLLMRYWRDKATVLAVELRDAMQTISDDAKWRREHGEVNW